MKQQMKSFLFAFRFVGETSVLLGIVLVQRDVMGREAEGQTIRHHFSSFVQL